MNKAMFGLRIIDRKIKDTEEKNKMSVRQLKNGKKMINGNFCKGRKNSGKQSTTNSSSPKCKLI